MKKNKIVLQTSQILQFLIMSAAVYSFSGCSDSVTSSGTFPADKHLVRTESQFALYSEMKAVPGAVIIDMLEDLNSPASAGDTGPIGEDIIPFSYTETAEHQFQIDTASAASFKIKFVSDATGEIIFELNNFERKLVIIPAGNYKMHLISLTEYSSSDSSSNAVFIQPNKISAYIGGGGTLYSIDELNTLIRVRKCFGCDLSYGNLDGLDLREVNISNSKFERASLIETNLSNATVIDCQFNNANLYKAKLNVTNMSGARGDSVNFSFASMNNTILTWCSLDECNFTRTVMDRAVFSAGVVSGSNFDRTKANYADFLEAQFMNNKAVGADFDYIKCGSTLFDGSKFIDCNFYSAQIVNSSLDYCDISGSILYYTNFCGTTKVRLKANNVIVIDPQCWP